VSSVHWWGAASAKKKRKKKKTEKKKETSPIVGLAICSASTTGTDHLDELRLDGLSTTQTRPPTVARLRDAPLSADVDRRAFRYLVVPLRRLVRCRAALRVTLPGTPVLRYERDTLSSCRYVSLTFAHCAFRLVDRVPKSGDHDSSALHLFSIDAAGAMPPRRVPSPGAVIELSCMISVGSGFWTDRTLGWHDERGHATLAARRLLLATSVITAVPDSSSGTTQTIRGVDNATLTSTNTRTSTLRQLRLQLRVTNVTGFRCAATFTIIVGITCGDRRGVVQPAPRCLVPFRSRARYRTGDNFSHDRSAHATHRDDGPGHDAGATMSGA